MWPLTVALAAVFGFSARALAVTAPPLHALPPRAATLLGSWTCTGPVAGSTSKEIFTSSGRTSLRLENGVRTGAGANGIVDETYAYDGATRSWTLTAPPNRFFDRIRLTATDVPGSDAGRWIFTGTQTTGGDVVPVRIVYQWLGPRAFRREHFEAAGGTWRANGAFVCRRAGEPQVAARRTARAVQRSLS